LNPSLLHRGAFFCWSQRGPNTAGAPGDTLGRAGGSGPMSATPAAPGPQVRGIPASQLRYAVFPPGRTSDGSLPLVWFSVLAPPGRGVWRARLVASTGRREIPVRIIGDTSARPRIEAALARARAALRRCRLGGRRRARVERIEARLLRMLRRDGETVRAVVVADPSVFAGFPDLRCAPAGSRPALVSPLRPVSPLPAS
jgi:hypothetical protein